MVMAVVGYNSDPVVRSVAEDGTQAAVRAADEFYTVFGGDVLDGVTVVLAYDATTNDLTFYKLNDDLTTASSVAMDLVWGGIDEGGLLWGSSYLPIAVGPHNLITVVRESGFSLVQFDATTGLHDADFSTIQTANAEPDRPLIVLNQDGTGAWVNRRDPSAGHEVVYFIALDGAGHLDASGISEPSWSTDDLDAQIMSTFDPVNENTILHIRGLRELPNGNLFIGGSNGSVVEVDPATGTILNFIPPWHFAFEIDGLALDPDGVHFWLTTNSTPNGLALPPPAGASGTDLCAWVIKMAFDGSVVDHFGARPAGSPMDLWMGVSVVVRGATDAAPAVDSVIRSVWRPTGELISNPVKLSVRPFVPPGQPPPPEKVPHGPPPIVTEPVTRKRRRRSPVQPISARNVSPWGSDVLVSRPESTPHPVTRDFGGVAMTAGGLAHNITEDAIETLFTPTYSPLPHRSNDDG